MISKTIDYYTDNASSFISSTVNVDMTNTQNRFISKLIDNSHILDFGCGSGRDTKVFIQKGFIVDAIDGCEEFCKAASEYTGINVKQMLFTELDEVERYDGIWACSSILHASKDELVTILTKCNRALKKRGVMYTSFKYGSFEGERNGRYFTDMTEKLFSELLGKVSGFSIEEQWITSDARPGRDEEKWLNVILRKI